jgi:hypothetical protein
MSIKLPNMFVGNKGPLLFKYVTYILRRESWVPSVGRHNMSAVQRMMCSERQKRNWVTAVPISFIT